MRNIQHVVFGLLLTSAALAGCGSAGSGEPVGTSEARITVSNQGSGAASLQVTATDDATSAVAIDKVVEVAAGSTAVLDLGVAASSYTFQIQAFADQAHTALLGSSTAHADLTAGAVTEINLTTCDAGGSGSGSVTASVNGAPLIAGIDVQVQGGGALGLVTGAQIRVDASDPEGGQLAFFWSGLGIEGSVQGSSTFDLSALAAATSSGPPVVHVIVQDGAGATTAVDVQFTPANGCILCGTFESSVATVENISAAAKACLDARASCTASCDAALAHDPTSITAHGSCVGACGLALAGCLAS